MKSYKGESAGLKEKTRKQMSSFRKPTPMVDPNKNDIAESCLFIASRPSNQQAEGPVLKNQASSPNGKYRQDLLLHSHNKIYNKTNKIGMIGTFNDPMKKSEHMQSRLRQTSGKQVKKMDLQLRPRSSVGDKFQKSIEIFQTPTNDIRSDARPGSSKSSRLFKKKSTNSNDAIFSENEETDSLIKVSRRESTQRDTTLISLQRTGTSLGRSRRFDKCETKLDAQFFNLFAP